MGNASALTTGFIVLEHDLFQQSVEIATGYILPDALARTPKLTLQPVITCVNKPLADAYIETNDNSTNPPPATIHPSCKFFVPEILSVLETYTLAATSGGSKPSTTGATGDSNHQSGGASPGQSFPALAALGLLTLISGLAVVF